MPKELPTLQRVNLLHGIRGHIPVCSHTVLYMHLSYREAKFSIPCW